MVQEWPVTIHFPYQKVIPCIIFASPNFTTPWLPNPGIKSLPRYVCTCQSVVRFFGKSCLAIKQPLNLHPFERRSEDQKSLLQLRKCQYQRKGRELQGEGLVERILKTTFQSTTWSIIIASKVPNSKVLNRAHWCCHCGCVPSGLQREATRPELFIMRMAEQTANGSLLGFHPFD